MQSLVRVECCPLAIRGLARIRFFFFRQLHQKLVHRKNIAKGVSRITCPRCRAILLSCNSAVHNLEFSSPTNKRYPDSRTKSATYGGVHEFIRKRENVRNSCIRFRSRSHSISTVDHRFEHGLNIEEATTMATPLVKVIFELATRSHRGGTSLLRHENSSLTLRGQRLNLKSFIMGVVNLHHQSRKPLGKRLPDFPSHRLVARL